MIVVKLRGRKTQAMNNFFDNLGKVTTVTGDALNIALAIYNASYKVIANTVKNEYDESITFEHEEDYVMFLLRWS